MIHVSRYGLNLETKNSSTTTDSIHTECLIVDSHFNLQLGISDGRCKGLVWESASSCATSFKLLLLTVLLWTIRLRPLILKPKAMPLFVFLAKRADTV